MSSEVHVVREVAWTECCRWLVLARAFRISVGFQLLLLAAFGAVLTATGWRVANRVLFTVQDVHSSESGGSGASNGSSPSQARERETAYLTKWPGERRQPVFPFRNSRTDRLSQRIEEAPADPIMSVPVRIVLPFWRVFDRHASWRDIVYYASGGIWTLVVWGFVGGAITRVAVVQLARDERIDLRQAVEFGQQRFFAHLTGPLMPLVGVALAAVPMIVLGWIMRLDVGVVLAGIFWVLVLLGGLLMSILLLALLFGWPLMWAAISAEGRDGFDAISRAYSYTLQRPLHYLFYVLVAALLGVLGWFVVWGVSETIIGASYWGVSWGVGSERMEEIVSYANTSLREPPAETTTPSKAFAAGSRLIHLWTGFLRSLASGYGFSYFWCAATAIYLLLRRDVDATEFDDIHTEEDEPPGLPKIKEETSENAESSEPSSTADASPPTPDGSGPPSDPPDAAK